MQFLYNLGIRLYGFSVFTASFFNEKARLWRSGRQNEFDLMAKVLNKKEDRIWMHCASLGEFEQGRPVLETLKKKHPEKKIIVTFFSPSGYEKKKQDSVIDYAFYLPLDTVANACKTICIFKPKLVIFVKYEFWFNYIQELYRQKIPVVFISVLMRKNHLFLKNYAIWFRKKLSQIDYFFVQDETSLQLFHKMGIYQVAVSGDTRYDRVLQIADSKFSIPEIEDFKSEKRLWIVGSSWLQDDVLIKAVFRQFASSYKLLIAPHEIHESRIRQIESLFADYHCVRYTDYEMHPNQQADVLILNTIGLLSKSYHYADVAYIGGAFGKGLHNILEAAVYGLPVFFGPHIQKFPEASALIQAGGACSVSQSSELLKGMQKLQSDEILYDTGEKSKRFVENRRGATEHIMTKLQEFFD